MRKCENVGDYITMRTCEGDIASWLDSRDWDSGKRLASYIQELYTRVWKDYKIIKPAEDCKKKHCYQ